ncbi:MAG: 2-oxo-4-hydroxy-4-carboxy-5-ureidoimidazoline decarboxylase [Burkholderiaceae bacterium]
MISRITLDELNAMPADDFITCLGGIFEHSPWVARQVLDRRPFPSVAALHEAMVDQVRRASARSRLELIRAHPELAGKAAIRGELTHESTREQAGAGLDQCSPQEYETLTALNRDYNQKFGFPFILAVRGYDRAGIIGQFRRRLALDPEQEQQECLEQIYRIALFRLNDLLQE